MTRITIWDLLGAALVVGLLIAWGVLGIADYAPTSPAMTREFPTLTPTPSVLLYVPVAAHDGKGMPRP